MRQYAMRRWVALVAVVAPVCLVNAQGLGQIAARENESRKATKHAGETYTDEDLQGPQGAARVLTAWVRNLHYPSATDPEQIRLEAEADLTSMHYRRAIQRVHPAGVLPDRVDRVEATARRGEDVSGFGSGIVVDAQVWFQLREDSDAGKALSTAGEGPEPTPTRPSGEASTDSQGDAVRAAASKRFSYNMPCSKARLPTCAACVRFQTELNRFAESAGTAKCAEQGLPTLVSYRNVSCTERPGGPDPVYEATCAP